MQNKFFKKQKRKINLGVLLCLCLLPVACLKQVNKNLSIVEAQRSYLEGDTTRAYKLSELLAFQNDPIAQYALGYMHYYGIGAPQNQKLAISWFKQAHGNGSEPALVALERIALAQGMDSIEGLNHQSPK